MNASHISLREDYEVTGVELDTLVESAWQQSGTCLLYTSQGKSGFIAIYKRTRNIQGVNEGKESGAGKAKQQC